MRCDYCGGSFEIEKFKYKGKTLKEQHRRKTLKFCLNCLCYGIPMSREKVGELWNEFKHTYYDSKDYDKMENLIFRHNCKVRKDTEKAIEILKANGFKVVSDRFAALS